MAPPKRRLTVLKDTPPEDESGRPPYQWAGFGAVAILVVWVPLAWLFGRLTRVVAVHWTGAAATEEELARAIDRLSPRDALGLSVTVLAMQATGLALAAAAGGFLVGRWGGAAGVREGVAAAALAFGIVVALTLLSSSFSFRSFVALPIALLAAAVGARVGRGRRSS